MKEPSSPSSIEYLGDHGDDSFGPNELLIKMIDQTFVCWNEGMQAVCHRNLKEILDIYRFVKPRGSDE